MQKILRDPRTRDTRVNQHMSDFSGSVRLLLRSKRLFFELAGKEVDLVFRGLI